MHVTDAMKLVIDEFHCAREMFPDPFHTNHEGYAVLLEEMDELWDAIKEVKPSGMTDQIRDEAVQVAAMALRFLVERY